MMFAQSVVEYGAIASVISSVERTAYFARAWVENNTGTLAIVAGALVLAWLLFGRGRSAR